MKFPAFSSPSRRHRTSIEPLEARVAPASLLGLDASNNLLSFDSATPGTVNTIAVGNLGAGETLIGIDFRPLTGDLYGITLGAASVGRLYTIDIESGDATLVGQLVADPTDLTAAYTALSGTAFGMDFNPVVDHIRLISNSEQNLQINPLNAQVITDGNINPGDPNIVDIAYRNNFAQAPSTILLGIDSAGDKVVSIDPASGTFADLGSLGIAVEDVLGFDVAGAGSIAFAAFRSGGNTGLYVVAPSGTASGGANIGDGSVLLRSLAVVPEAVWDGGGADANWTTPENWVGDIAPVPGYTLIFPDGAAQKTNTNDFPNGTLFDSVRIVGTAYTLGGNSIQLGGEIFADSGSDSTIDFPITLSASTGDPKVIHIGGVGNPLNFGATSTLDLNGRNLNFTGEGTATFDGVVSDGIGGGDIVVEGSTLATTLRVIFNADNTYDGTTTVENRALEVNGLQSGSAVFVNGPSALIGGIGTVGPLTSTGGTVAPGPEAGPLRGTLHVMGDFELDAASETRFSAINGTNFDQIEVTGAVTLGGNLAPAGTPGDQWTIILNDDVDPVVGTFDGLDEGDTVTIGAFDYEISYVGGSGNDVVLTKTFTQIPVTLVNKRTATWTDRDGDLVTLKVTKGELGTDDFFVAAQGGFGGGQLLLLNFSDDVLGNGKMEFEGTKITLTAVPQNGNGNGKVDVGYINAQGLDLASVLIPGDLGQIDAGDADGKPALGKLMVDSMGVQGTTTQGFNASPESNIIGPVGSILVAGNVTEASIFVTGGAVPKLGKIGKLTINGGLFGGDANDSGQVFTTGDIGVVSIGTDLEGGNGDRSALISAGGKIKKVTIGSDILGGAGLESGRIFSIAGIGPVVVNGNVEGGAGIESGSIESDDGPLTSVKINGSLIGGTGSDSAEIDSQGNTKFIHIVGSIMGGPGEDSAQIDIADALVNNRVVGGNLGLLRVDGSIIGGNVGDASGSVLADGKIAKVLIGGNLVGGEAHDSGRIASQLGLGTVLITQDVVGNDGENSGSIFSDGLIKKVTVNGSVLGGDGDFSGGIFSGGPINSVKIALDLIGGGGELSGAIEAEGSLKSVVIDGSITSSNGSRSGAIVTEVQLGLLKVTGNITGDVFTPVSITAFGAPKKGKTTDVAIKKIIVQGDIEFADILAGYGAGSLPLNEDAQISLIQVTGNMTATNIVAGIEDVGDDGFGNADDSKIAADTDNIVSTIAKIIVGGVIDGFGGGDDFGITAELVKSIKIGPNAVVLTPGKHNDQFIEVPGSTSFDYFINEVA